MARRPARLRGPLLQSRFHWVRRSHGPQGVARVMAALPEVDRGLLEGMERDGWYPLSTFLHLERVIVDLYGSPGTDLSEELGAHSARVRLEWLREHAPLISVHALLARAAEDHGIFADFGEARYVRRAFREGAVELSGFTEPSLLLCRSYRGYVSEIVRQNGAVDPVVEETLCQARGDATCTFVVRWAAAPADSSGPG